MRQYVIFLFALAWFPISALSQGNRDFTFDDLIKLDLDISYGSFNRTFLIDQNTNILGILLAKELVDNHDEHVFLTYDPRRKELKKHILDNPKVKVHRSIFPTKIDFNDQWLLINYPSGQLIYKKVNEKWKFYKSYEVESISNDAFLNNDSLYLCRFGSYSALPQKDQSVIYKINLATNQIDTQYIKIPGITGFQLAGTNHFHAKNQKNLIFYPASAEFFNLKMESVPVPVLDTWSAAPERTLYALQNPQAGEIPIETYSEMLKKWNRISRLTFLTDEKFYLLYHSPLGDDTKFMLQPYSWIKTKIKKLGSPVSLWKFQDLDSDLVLDQSNFVPLITVKNHKWIFAEDFLFVLGEEEDYKLGHVSKSDIRTEFPTTKRILRLHVFRHELFN